MPIPKCWTEGEGAVKGEIGSEGRSGGKRGRDAKIKFTCFLLSGPCRQQTRTEPETLHKLQRTSPPRMPRKRVETIPAPLWGYLTLPAKPVRSDHWVLAPPVERACHWAQQESRSCANHGELCKVLSTHLGKLCYRKLLTLASWNGSRVWLGFPLSSSVSTVEIQGIYWDGAQQQNRADGAIQVTA